MNMAVVGSYEFSLGFMLVGIDDVFQADSTDAAGIMEKMLHKEEFAIIIVQEELMDALPRYLRYKITNAIKPLFVGVGRTSGSGLQEKVKRAVGIDLMENNSPSEEGAGGKF